MYYLISQILFWSYWLTALSIGLLLFREILRGENWRVQVTAALAILPFIMRVLLIK